MVAIVVTFEIHPGKEAEIIAALEGNAIGSRAEPGCYKWEWSRHLEDPLKFAIYELYENKEAIKAHKASAHFAEWLGQIDGVIASKTAGQYDVTGADSQPVPAA